MLKYSKDGISVLLILDSRRELKEGAYPVKIQVVQNRKQRYYSTGKNLTVEEWEKLFDSKSKGLADIRRDFGEQFLLYQK